MKRIEEDLRKWFDPKHPEGGWKRINSKGEVVGPCARELGEPKPKCMSNEKRAMLSKGERASAVRTKRKHDPNPEREGKPIMVSNFGKGKISEGSEESRRELDAYRALEMARDRSIPMGTIFKATGGYRQSVVDARNTPPEKKPTKKKPINEKNEPTNKELWSKIQSLVSGKVSSIEYNGKTIEGPNNGKGFKVHPSAYSNGWASGKYKELGGDWKSVKEQKMIFSDFVDKDEILLETASDRGIMELIAENECEGRQSGKPWRTPGEKKKFAVCVDGKIVRFGDPGLSIKRDQPGRLKNFRARHGCDKGGISRDTPKYWSCQMWRKDKSVGDMTGGD